MVGVRLVGVRSGSLEVLSAGPRVVVRRVARDERVLAIGPLLDIGEWPSAGPRRDVVFETPSERSLVSKNGCECPLYRGEGRTYGLRSRLLVYTVSRGACTVIVVVLPTTVRKAVEVVSEVTVTIFRRR